MAKESKRSQLLDHLATLDPKLSLWQSKLEIDNLRQLLRGYNFVDWNFGSRIDVYSVKEFFQTLQSIDRHWARFSADKQVELNQAFDTLLLSIHSRPLVEPLVPIADMVIQQCHLL